MYLAKKCFISILVAIALCRGIMWNEWRTTQLARRRGIKSQGGLVVKLKDKALNSRALESLINDRIQSDHSDPARARLWTTRRLRNRCMWISKTAKWESAKLHPPWCKMGRFRACLQNTGQGSGKTWKRHLIICEIPNTLLQDTDTPTYLKCWPLHCTAVY